MAMIGRNAAVAEVGAHRHQVEGPIAFAAWLGLHAILLSGAHSRVDAFLNWADDYFHHDRAPDLELERHAQPHRLGRRRRRPSDHLSDRRKLSRRSSWTTVAAGSTDRHGCRRRPHPRPGTVPAARLVAVGRRASDRTLAAAARPHTHRKSQKEVTMTTSVHRRPASKRPRAEARRPSRTRATKDTEATAIAEASRLGRGRQRGSALARLGTVPVRTRLGHGPRGLQRRR